MRNMYKCYGKDLKGSDLNIKKKPRYNLLIAGNIDEGLYNRVLDGLNNYLANKSDYSGINLFITSLGGAVHIAFAIYDLLKAHKISIYTVALGECTSAATIIFSLGKKRFAGPNTVFLFHTAILESSEVCNQQVFTDKLFRLKASNNKMEDAYKKTKGITDEFVKFIEDLFKNNETMTFSVEELLKYGFVTEILNDFRNL